MKFPINVDFNEFIGYHSLIYGENDTKKTYYTAKFVQFLIEHKKFIPKEISILDFAPKLSFLKNLKIGGKIQDYYKNSVKCNNITFKGEIIPPRLNASNKIELYENACRNHKKTSEILEKFSKNPTSILIVNDASIYLHLGSVKLLIKVIKKTDTFFGNSYYGNSIKQDFATLFSLREKKLVEHLIGEIEKSYLME